jgi:putative DNA primase/helicase
MDTLRRRRVAAANAQALAAANADRAAAVTAEQLVEACKVTKAHVQGCLYLFESLVTEQNADTFDSEPDLLNVQNGVLHLRTGTLAQHCPRQRFTYVLPVAYDPEADVSAWHNFIHEAVGGNDEVCHFLQRATGYGFTGHTREEKLLYLYGQPRAGKGTYAETIQKLLPHPISAAVDFNSFTARRDTDTQNFDLAPLRPARIVFASESNKYQALNPAKIKQLTGGDSVYCAFKHKDHFRYRPQYLVILLSNHEVRSDAEDDALWGRILVVHFPVSHLGAEDTGLKARLQLPEHLQGLLRWVVEGAMEWYRDGLQPPEKVRQATQQQRDAQDYARQWANDSCIFHASAWTSSKALMESYREWCDANNIKPGTAKDLAASLVHLGCTPYKQANSGPRGFRGIAMHGSPDAVQQSGSPPENGEDSSTYAHEGKGGIQLDSWTAGLNARELERTTPIPSPQSGHEAATETALLDQVYTLNTTLMESWHQADESRTHYEAASVRHGANSLQAQAALAEWERAKRSAGEVLTELHRLADLSGDKAPPDSAQPANMQHPHPQAV